MGYQKTPTMGYQKAHTPSTTRSRKKPNTTASKVLGAGLSNTNDSTNEESIAAGDNGILEGVGTITAGGLSNTNDITNEESIATGDNGMLKGVGTITAG
nr:hypothetical protein [Tanacetum cinerariifolium]